LKSSATHARAAVVTAEESLVETRTRIKDLEREVARAENDVETVRMRITRDQQTLDTGAATPKHLTDIQHELESLARRQAELEDVELEILERMEEATSGLADAEGLLAESRARAAETAAEWDRRADEIAAETVALEGRRADLVGTPCPANWSRCTRRSGIAPAWVRGCCGTDAVARANCSSAPRI
jgi:predicted  nucleic acid-binding Zn-ribbon protein